VSIGALLAAVALLLANAFFVAGEFAMVAARRTRMERLAEAGSARARIGVRLSSELSFQLAGAQLGITMASLGLGFVAEPAVADLIAPVVEALGLPDGAAHSVSLVVALSLVTYLHTVVGEMVPKNVTISRPEQSLMWLAYPTLAYASLFRPFIRLLNATANGLTRLLGVEPRDELEMTHSADELARMLAASREQGLLEEFEHLLLRGALQFGGRTARSVMVPRERIRAVAGTTPVAEVEREAVDSGHSRLLVYGRDLDDVLGFVHAKDLLDVPLEARDRPVPRSRIRRMLVMPEDRRLQELLLAMRRARLHMAVVLDGQGRTVGLVTLEDLLEELVGDIRDEHDVARPRRARR
jgi:CBS domain containing-hemolysin-like protein